MANNTINPNPNTAVFACLEPQVAILIADIIHAIYSILNWRQSSKSFLVEILARLGELNKFECSHFVFSEILFPSLEETARKVKVGRWAQKLIEDMEKSLFRAVWIIPRRVGQSENGKYYGLPTLYKRGDFWKLFRAIQDAATECDLLNLPLRNRRQKVRVIVELWLMKNGAKRIIREKKEKDGREDKSEKEKSTSPPCKCSCASCAHCAAKGATASEAENGAWPAWERVSGQTVEAQIRTAMEILFTSGQQWMNMNRSLPDFVRKIHAGFDIEELRLRDAVKRVNRNGGLKLMGGQPK